MRFGRQFALLHLFIFTTAVFVCVLLLKLEPTPWWDIDQSHLTEFVRDRIVNSRQVEVIRVSPDGKIRGVVDKSTTNKMANTFDLLSRTRLGPPACGEYFSITIVGEKQRISFDVVAPLAYAIFGDGKWERYARVDQRFVDILESTIHQSQQVKTKP